MKAVRILFISLVLLFFASACAANPQSVSFSEHSIVIDLAFGNSYTLTGTVYPEDAPQQLNWYSSNDFMFTVKDGVLTAYKTGEGIVRANVPGITAIGDKCAVLIKDSRIPSSLTINVPANSIEPGDSVLLDVTADNPLADTAVSWKTSDVNFATIDQDGVLTAHKAGTIRVFATSLSNPAVSAVTTVSLSYLPKPDSLVLSEHTLDAEAGSTYQISWEISPATATRRVSFKSSNERIAWCDNDGVIHVEHEGDAVITIYMNGYPAVSDSITVHATDPRIPEAISIIQKEIAMEPANGALIEAVALPEGLPCEFVYESSNKKIATVDENGIVTAKNTGSCVIKVTSAFTDDVFAEIPVNIKYGPKLKSFKFSTAAIDMNRGETIPLPCVFYPENGSRAIEFKSDNENIVKVNYDGTITAVRKGQATITGYYYRDISIRSTITVNVDDPYWPEEMHLSIEHNTALEVGSSIDFTVIAKPASANTACIIENTRPDIISLEGNTLTALKRGITDIKVISLENEELSFTVRVCAVDGSRILTVPLRRTDADGIQDNLDRIESVRQSTYDEIDRLESDGIIDETEAAGRRHVIDNAFHMYAFPWTVEREQRYWNAANSQDGAKNFRPGTIYYGLPYISGASGLHCFSLKQALKEGRYVPVEGEDYYMLEQNNPQFGTVYVGNDCSAFVALCMFGTAREGGEAIKTTTLYSDERLDWISDASSLRPGDIMVHYGSHVVMFLYWADEDHTQAMFIEQGGSEYAINTISVNVYNLTYYTENYYRVRRLKNWRFN